MARPILAGGAAVAWAAVSSAASPRQVARHRPGLDKIMFGLALLSLQDITRLGAHVSADSQRGRRYGIGKTEINLRGHPIVVPRCLGRAHKGEPHVQRFAAVFGLGGPDRLGRYL